MKPTVSRTLILSAAMGLMFTGNVALAQQSSSLFGQEITVYKTPTCGCCGAWADYLKTRGLKVTTIVRDDLDTIRAEHGLTDPTLKSCHTAVVDGYVVEGHVPVDDISRLLSERPDVVGITAPGMPAQSPGMGSEEPHGYDVLSFDEAGNREVFSSY